jgi:hypothetical protein
LPPIPSGSKRRSLPSQPHVDSLHVDIDGQFAPAFGLGERLVSGLAKICSKPIDIHLMVDSPEYWAPRFAALGARIVCVHAESDADIQTVLRSVCKEGAAAYVALRPDTPISGVRNLLDEADGALLLTALRAVAILVKPRFKKPLTFPVHILPSSMGASKQPILKARAPQASILR